MKKRLLIAASALIFAVGAADKVAPELDFDEEVIAGMVDWEDLEPRLATRNYPACRPGRGDDRCIQLYERGVRAALAEWDEPTGGWEGDVRLASMERRSAHHDTRAEVDDHYDEDPMVDDDEPVALGGPVERRENYPVCSGDDDDDRCVQAEDHDVDGEEGTPGI